ncbi:hypothetical protein HK104_011196 [Borealophlyctis nickersoniae]|nr:hypothetical protein HK104_011196 [Borealophlyctis nickersoniae]
MIASLIALVSYAVNLKYQRQIFTYITIGATSFVILLELISVILAGVQLNTAKGTLPRRQRITLGAGFGMAITAMLLAIGSDIALVVGLLRGE